MMSNAALTVLAACLSLLLPALPAAAQAARADAPAATRTVLSVSWQAGYCAARPKSRGCADFSAAASEARQFSLHSLWQPRRSYCGVEASLKQQARKGKWIDLPELALADGTKARLAAAMPAVRVGLDRQQWLRSGSCVAASPEAYYGRSLDLLDELNASAVPALLAGKAGGEVTLSEVRAAFDAAFGNGTGERVRLSCRKAGERQMVVGLTIGLGPGEGGLAALAAASPPTRSRCTAGFTAAAQGG
ncbi:ribonuclease T2 family protein [Shinella pollutisoli]|uniref:Ribonuclease n=1 Tax=Shinella pollutisoli TaxID=2250594 RepID=A0ABV7DJM4_9HYPH|nr:ribonuclease [Shinella pollutisoli]